MQFFARWAVLECNFSPVLFDFDPASNLDISDTFILLAKMAQFVIADVTDPRSVQQELTMIAPNVVVAIQPILLAGHEPWSSFQIWSGAPVAFFPFKDTGTLMIYSNG